MNPYDEVPYPGFPYTQTQPDRLAVLAHLLGMNPASPHCCRVLELGCGSGDSLISFAVSLPESGFLGVDLSETAIRKGNRVISELGLRNVRLEHCDLMGFQGAQYDYIVAHGLYSWVPPAVQLRIFEIIRDCLAPEGVAYVSYNVLPGGHFPLMLREIMLYHGAGFESPKEKVEQAFAIIEFIAGAQEKPNEYGRLMAEEWKRLSERSHEAIYHDELGSWTAPLYFQQFMEKAAGYGLQFLAEARFQEMQAHNLLPHAAKLLRDFGDDVLRREQYLDFLRGRRFRQTLLCRDSATVQRSIPVERVVALHAGTHLSMQTPDPGWVSGAPVKFKGERELTFSSTDPLTTAALMCLTESWPVPLPFDQIWEKAQRRLAGAGCNEDLDSSGKYDFLAGRLLALFGSGVVQFWVARPRIGGYAGALPMASPLARWQAEGNDKVTTLLHTTIEIDAMLRRLLQLLDGTRNREALAAELGPVDVDAGLAKLAKAGVLLPES
jgi:methyltransferase-like protein